MMQCSRLIVVSLLLTCPLLALSGKATELEGKCMEIVAAAKDKSERDGAYAVYTQCRRIRAQTKGAEKVDRDCRELAHLFQVARHYSVKEGTPFSESDFCVTAVQSGPDSGDIQPPTDPKLAEHQACVAGVEQVLSSSEVSEAAEKACRQAHPREAEAPAKCHAYVSAIAEAPRDGLLDASRLCDRMLTGNGNGTQNIDEDQFVYSCVLYATNLMTSLASHEQGVSKMQQSCEAHLSSQESGFCADYVRLVHDHASRSEITRFCEAQFQKKIQDASVPAMDPQSTSATASPQAASVAVQATTATPVAAQAHVAAKRKIPDMIAVCANMMNQVTIPNLAGKDLENEAVSLCKSQLQGLDAAERPPLVQINVGCRFFARRLSKAQQAGPLNKQTFCASLASKRTNATVAIHNVAAKPEEKLKKVKESAPAVRMPAAAASSSSGAFAIVGAVTNAVVSDSKDFLNAFLDNYEAGNKNNLRATAAKQQHFDEVRQKVTKLFGPVPEQKAVRPTVPVVPAPPPAVKAAPLPTPAPVVPAASVVPAAQVVPATPVAAPVVSALQSSQGQNDFLASFVNTYSASQDAPVLATGTSALQLSAEPSPGAPLEAAAMEAPPIAPASSGGDIDSLVSSFLSRNL